MDTSLSFVRGSTDEVLSTSTVGSLIQTQALHYGSRTAVIVPWQKKRLTYHDLLVRSKVVAKALVQSGLKHGDRVGITAGNCAEYIEVFLGAARIGCPVVVLNSTYTPTELMRAVEFSGCKMLCVAQSSGPRLDLSEHLELLSRDIVQDLQLVLFNGQFRSQYRKVSATPYDAFLSRAAASFLSDVELATFEGLVRPNDVLNLQFTSGTTGAPKASMLTHMNLINNGMFVGKRLHLSLESIICCPPPLFHCFGLVMGFLGTFTHGSSIVFPSQQFDSNLVLDAIEAERCTILYGVPTMFVAELDANKKHRRDLSSLKIALGAGSLVPQSILERLEREMGIASLLIMYGMTETSPVTFSTRLGDSRDNLLTTVGTVFPHTVAKIIDHRGHVVPRGVRGEICTGGFALQKGYFANEAKTREVMKMDEDGKLWMHTGDEGVIDEAGFCRVTGRIKDLIIRGGENITPAEIEDRLLAHESIAEASVVGLPDEKYGEVVACFLRHKKESSGRPNSARIVDWVRQALGRHKAPKYVFWIGDAGVGDDYPKTGSGKHQKHILRKIGTQLLRAGMQDDGSIARPKL